MKLVELLAKELKKWPSVVEYYCCDYDGEIRAYSKDEEENQHDFFPLGDSSVDIADRAKCAGPLDTVRVTKNQWIAERERLSGGKWIRARGRKPNYETESPQRMEIRHRDGTITQGWTSQDWSWTWHDGAPKAEIMAWRIITQPQAEEAKLSRLETRMLFSEPCIVYPESTEAKTDQIDGPIKWRDTIIHCQAIIEDCEREIQRNVDLLDAEGLMMQTDSKKAMQHYAPDVDMSDWRNWKVGDEVEVILENDANLPVGQKYIVREVEQPEYAYGMPICVNTGAGKYDYQWPEDSEHNDRLVFKFIRRP